MFVSHRLNSRSVRRPLAAAVGAACVFALAACGSSGNSAAQSSAPSQGLTTSVATSEAVTSPSVATSEAVTSPSDATSEAVTSPSDATSEAPTGATPRSMLPPELAKKGVLIVGSNIEYPPFESYAPDGTTVVGIDREIADELEKQLGVTLKFENAAFDALIPGLAAGRYDMVMSAMTDTKQREQQVDFVDYLKAGGAIMLPKDNPQKVASLDDLCGLKVAIDKGTTEVADAAAQSTKCTAAGKKPLDSAIYPGNNQMILALQSGRADAALIDYVSGEPIASQSNGAFVMLPPYRESYFGIVFPKGSTQLQKAVQAALTAMVQDGSYQKIFVKYGLPDAPLDNFPINNGTEG